MLAVEPLIADRLERKADLDESLEAALDDRFELVEALALHDRQRRRFRLCCEVGKGGHKA